MMSLIFAKAPRRQRVRRPRHFLQHGGIELGAEAQRLLGDDDRLRRHLRLASAAFFACMLAWLLSQTWAMNTASKPNTTANPIMTMVLARTTMSPV